MLDIVLMNAHDVSRFDQKYITSPEDMACEDVQSGGSADGRHDFSVHSYSNR